MQAYTHFEKTMLELVMKNGGWVNAHAHLDRANTTDDKYLRHISTTPIQASTAPLAYKQHMTGDLHRGPAYDLEDLEQRMREQLNIMIELGVHSVSSLIDTTADNVKLTALEVALKLKEEFKDKIEFRVGSYGIFGFKDDEVERWEIFVEASKIADYLGSLPERDAKGTHIGYDEHLIRVLELGAELDKEVHIHVDQANDPREDGTETLVDAVRFSDFRNYRNGTAKVWAIHAISPTCYTERRFQTLVKNLVEHNIGVICCPSAALSMRQLRPILTPTHNSIARVFEMVEQGVDVRMGTDNIGDVYVPQGTPDMYKEIWLLGVALRFNIPDILAKLATATPLNDMDRLTITRVLDQDREVWEKTAKELVEEERRLAERPVY